MLAGGKTGVSMGFAIVPGVLTICTLVMMLTKGPSADGTYTGAAYEGIALLPWVGEKLSFLCVCGKEAVAAGVKAGDLIRQISAIAGGKGGGKPDSAMGGGTDVSKLDAAVASLKPFVEEIVSK
jgi:hypothetical protein